MIPVTCIYCGLKILVPPSVQGHQGTCLNCGSPITVPVTDSVTATGSLEFKENDRVGDRYVIKSFIGRGGMGVVYCAEDTLVNEVVALKFLRRGVLRTDKGRKLFLREAQVARRLRHENIIAVHDVGFTGEGVLYISMEYAVGASLRDFLMRYRRNRRHIPVKQAIHIMLQILDALHYAHRWVIHRDIKPENIMLLNDNQVKVLDFGLAKAVEEDVEKQGDGSPPKRVAGTPVYASPEQLLRQPLDTRSDIYTAGLLLRELLTLRTPRELPPDKDIQRSDVAPSISAVADKAIREDKTERWQTAQEFYDALKSAFETSYQSHTVNTAAIMNGKTASTEGMIFFEGGYFHMGNDSMPDAAPETEVYVTPFWMDVYPVTVSQYEKYLKETGAAEPAFWRNPQFNGPDQPVVGITWKEAIAYAAWLGKQLPTEAQWEFAARGPENRRYPWGNMPADTTRCNFRNYLGMPSMVTMHEEGKTPEGVVDMAGNVYEWTMDTFAPYEKQRTAPDSLSKFPQKTVRGGCYESENNDIQTWARKGIFPDVREKYVGFRCVVPQKQN